MAQFKYRNEMNSLFGMDGPITKGSPPRWQKKKTPSKSKSPSRSTTSTPNGGDRFIASRSNSNFDLDTLEINQAFEESEVPSPQTEMQRILSENVRGNDASKQRILPYQTPMRIIYTQTKTPVSVKGGTSRYIPQTPDRILDAPDIIDDYYLNLMDWSSSNNLLAVALGANVYLWHAGTGTVEQLPKLADGKDDYVCSLCWKREASDHLAVGTTTGTVELWDCSQLKRVRVMEGHSARVGALSWNSYILSSGCRRGRIINHDVRLQNQIVNSINGHSQQEVCGLQWSTDGKYLASGGNDNVLNIWLVASGSYHAQSQALHTFTSHQAAVKALAWCPWKPDILASGGGTADGCIRFWNVKSGACLNSVDTKSQVCSLLWSGTYRELVSGHGFAHNQLIIWKYPTMDKVAELTGHTARVLHLAMSPDGSTVLSAGADETLRFWKCFMPE